MKRDRFEEILRAKLQDSGADRAVPAWGEMERRIVLSENAAGLPAKRTLRPGLRYGIAAAILLMLGFGVYQFGRHTERSAATLALDTTGLQTLPGLENAVTADQVVPSETIKDPALAKLFNSVRSVTSIAPSQTARNPLNQQLASVTSSGHAATASIMADAGFAPGEPVTASNETAAPDAGHQATKSALPTAGSADRRASYRNGFDWNKELRPRSKGWMVAAYTSAYASSASDVKRIKSPTAFNAALVESNYTKNAMEFVGRNLNHHFPVSIGFNVKKKVTKRFGIETGLVYTYLESSGELDAEYTYKYRQKVHYLGIPVNLSYSLYQNRTRRFDTYLMGGFMAEIPLSARATTQIFDQGIFASDISESLEARGLLWSVGMGAGVSYDFVQNFGLYLEPGASYYFRNLDQPITYRTDNPWSFNVRVGLRFKF